MVSITRNADVCLADDSDWFRFSPNMEMIARERKGKEGVGNMLCPQLVFKVTGLEPEKKYGILLSLERTDKRVLTYDEKKKWIESDKRDEREDHEYKRIKHSDGIQTGAKWMESPILFDKVRITNRSKSANVENTFYVTPQHRYDVTITVRNAEEERDEAKIHVQYANFIAVTVYQNKELSNWKCAKNKCVTNENKRKALEPEDPANPKKKAKRKASDGGVGAPVAKRSIFGEKQVEQPIQPTGQVLQVQPTQQSPQLPLGQPPIQQYIPPQNCYPPMAPVDSSFNDYNHFSNHYYLQNDYNYNPTVYQPFYPQQYPQPQYDLDHNENFNPPHFPPFNNYTF